MKETFEEAVRIATDLVNSDLNEFDSILFVNNLRLNQIQSIILYSVVESVVNRLLLAHGDRDREAWVIDEFANELALVLDEDYDELYYFCNS